VSEFLTQNLQPGDICLFLGAGSLNQIIPDVVEFYRCSTGEPNRANLSAKQPETVV
jgi:UDP-N-acetylmuramate--alanine ligase